ncbi:IGSF6 protein, partial [Heliornis fulica]|nr:IGSF6 protein [Heliornis fulica]
MASFNKLKNILMLAFDWILYSTGDTDTCKVTVTQPRFQKADYSVQTVFLSCVFSASGCSPSPPQVLWFRFLTNKHEDLCTPECKMQEKFKVHFLSKTNVSLQINNLTVEDSAVYICGISFSNSGSWLAKQTGDGTVLTKTEKQHGNGKLVLMIIASSLMFLYSTVVFVFFAIQKVGSKEIFLDLCQFKYPLKKKINSGRKIFQAIAQELQKQKYAERYRQPDDLEDDNIYQNR